MTSSLRWSVAGGLLGGVALLGCDLQVLEYEDSPETEDQVASGGQEASGGQMASEQAGDGGSQEEATGGTGGQLASTGGQPSLVAAGGSPQAVGGSNLGGATQTDEFQWPELPTERGVVAGVEPWDTTASGCCSRVPGGVSHELCMEGIQDRLVLEIERSQEVQSLQFNMAAVDGFSMVLMSARPEESVSVGVMETSIVPPEGIVDLSPVFWVGSDGPFPATVTIYLPVSQYGYSANDPGVKTVLVYYSEDGAEFEALERSPLEVFGNGALMTQPGFVVLGAGPDVITCHP